MATTINPNLARVSALYWALTWDSARLVGIAEAAEGETPWDSPQDAALQLSRLRHCGLPQPH